MKLIQINESAKLKILADSKYFYLTNKEYLIFKADKTIEAETENLKNMYNFLINYINKEEK